MDNDYSFMDYPCIEFSLITIINVIIWKQANEEKCSLIINSIWFNYWIPCMKHLLCYVGKLIYWKIGFTIRIITILLFWWIFLTFVWSGYRDKNFFVKPSATSLALFVVGPTHSFMIRLWFINCQDVRETFLFVNSFSQEHLYCRLNRLRIFRYHIEQEHIFISIWANHYN